jgi:hypothetical protein
MMLDDRMPRTAGVNGGTQPAVAAEKEKPEPLTSEEQAPYDPGPGQPSPDGSGSVQSGDDKPDPPPAAPSAPLPGEPAPAAARLRSPLEEFSDHLLEENLRLDRANHRLELAMIAAFLAASPTLNFLRNAVSRLDADDWRSYRDLAVTLHQQASELAEMLKPLATAEKVTLAAAQPRRFSVVS